MTPFYFAPQRITLAAFPVTLAVVGVLVLMHPVSLPSPAAPTAYAASDASSTVYLSASAATSAAQITDSQASLSEMHIANNGLTLLRNARVVSVQSGGAIQVSLAWSGAQFTWNVHTAYGTEIMDANGAKKQLSDVHEGDIVTVTGQLQQGGDSPYVVAQYIRDQNL